MENDEHVSDAGKHILTYGDSILFESLDKIHCYHGDLHNENIIIDIDANGNIKNVQRKPDYEWRFQEQSSKTEKRLLQETMSMCLAKTVSASLARELIFVSIQRSEC